MTRHIKLAILAVLIHRAGAMQTESLFKKTERVQFEPWRDEASPAVWKVQPFLKTGFCLLAGLPQSGKSSLCVALAKAEAVAKPYWQGGGCGKGGKSLFVSAGILQADHIQRKLGQPDSKAIIAGGVKVSYSHPSLGEHERRLTAGCLIDLVQKIKPSLVFFDFEVLGAPAKFFKELSGLDCALVGLMTKTPRSLDKSIPVLKIIKQVGGYRKLIKRQGFEDSPGGSLTFQLKHCGHAFRAQNFEFRASETIDKQSLEDQSTRFKIFLQEQIDRGQDCSAGEIKKQARQQGFSTYFLSGLNWQKYGYRAEGRGFGSEFRQVLQPFEQ